MISKRTTGWILVGLLSTTIQAVPTEAFAAKVTKHRLAIADVKPSLTKAVKSAEPLSAGIVGSALPQQSVKCKNYKLGQVLGIHQPSHYTPTGKLDGIQNNAVVYFTYSGRVEITASPGLPPEAFVLKKEPGQAFCSQLNDRSWLCNSFPIFTAGLCTVNDPFFLEK